MEEPSTKMEQPSHDGNAVVVGSTMRAIRNRRRKKNRSGAWRTSCFRFVHACMPKSDRWIILPIARCRTLHDMGTAYQRHSRDREWSWEPQTKQCERVTRDVAIRPSLVNHATLVKDGPMLVVASIRMHHSFLAMVDRNPFLTFKLPRESRKQMFATTSVPHCAVPCVEALPFVSSTTEPGLGRSIRSTTLSSQSSAEERCPHLLPRAKGVCLVNPFINTPRVAVAPTHEPTPCSPPHVPHSRPSHAVMQPSKDAGG